MKSFYIKFFSFSLLSIIPYFIFYFFHMYMIGFLFLVLVNFILFFYLNKTFMKPIKLFKENLVKKNKVIEIETHKSLPELFEKINELIENVSEVNKASEFKSNKLLEIQHKISETIDNNKYEELKEIGESLYQGGERQKENVEKNIEAMKQIVDSVSEVAMSTQNVFDFANNGLKNAKDGSEIVKDVYNQIHSINEKFEKLSTVILKLEKHSSEIGNIISVITEISNQTNLLALNASIEAARAGEQGKGFAVVADEVKKLADKSSISIKQIKDLVNSIQEESKNSVLLMSEGNLEVLTGLEKVDNAEKSFTEIGDSLNKLTMQIQSISSFLEELNATTTEVINLTDITKKVQIFGNTKIRKTFELVNSEKENYDDIKKLNDEISMIVKK